MTPYPRLPLVLLVDASMHTSTRMLPELERGFRAFTDEMHDHPCLRESVDVAVVTFGSSAALIVPFQEQEIRPTAFRASGWGGLGPGLDLALDQLVALEARYRAAGIEYGRPWLFVITGSQPLAADSIARLRIAQNETHIVTFVVGFGDDADWEFLESLSGNRRPAKLVDGEVSEMFQWLLASLEVVATSASFGGAACGRHTSSDPSLPSPLRWAEWPTEGSPK